MAKRMAAKGGRKGSDRDDARIYKMTELVGTSRTSFADAANAAVERACKTLRNVDWFEVCELRGAIAAGRVREYQVKLKVGFRMD
jgi:hypothetical protein